MINTGEFVIGYYNHYGSRLKTLNQVCSNLVISHQIAKDFIQCDTNVKNQDEKMVACSYTLDRRIYNSLDRSNRF